LIYKESAHITANYNKNENCQKTVTYLCYGYLSINQTNASRSKKYLIYTINNNAPYGVMNMKKQGIIAAAYDLNEVKRYALLLLVAMAMYLLFYSQASATPVAEVLCSVASMIFLDVGRAIATLAIVTLGISALLGKATWAQALTICTGIGIMVGAPYLMMSLTMSVASIVTGIGAGIASPFSLATSAISLAGCMR